MYIDLKLRRQSKVFVCAYIIAIGRSKCHLQPILWKKKSCVLKIGKKSCVLKNWKKELRIDLMVLLHGI